MNELKENGKEYEFVTVDKLTFETCSRLCDLKHSCMTGERIYPCNKETGRKDGREGYFKAKDAPVYYGSN